MFYQTVSVLGALIAIQVNAHGSDLSFTSETAPETVDKSSMIKCLACSTGVNAVSSIVGSETFITLAHAIAIKVCDFTQKIPVKQAHCQGIISEMQPQFIDTLQNLFARDRICDEWMGYCNSPVITEIDLHQAVNRILADKPDHIKDDNFINNMYSDMKTTDTLKAILLTDVHIDLEYKEGMNVDCGDILCCRAENGPPGPGQEASGEWGAGTCDPPVKTVNAVLDQIVALSPDIVFWTGDNSPHDIWNLTEDDVTNLTIKTTQMIKEKFEGTNITVIPTQGNHDTWPVDIQSFEKPNENYPINHFKDHWADWLDEEALAKFGEYGFYSMDLKLKNGKATPHGSKIISLNTNASEGDNWKLINERSDPGRQMEWLENELHEIEANGGVAYIVSHEQPNTYLNQFGTRFRAISERFQHVIRLGFHGHIHEERVNVASSMTNPEKPVLIHAIGGSVTPLSGCKSNGKCGSNPMFMSLDINADTLLPININSHYFDLDDANITGAPVWQSHDYLQTYGMKDLSPQSILDMAESGLNDANLTQLLAWNKIGRWGDLSEAKINQVDEYCEVASSTRYEENQCFLSGGKERSAYGTPYDFKSNKKNWLFEKLINNWITINN